MKKSLLVFAITLYGQYCLCQQWLTPFEKSGEKETTTYYDCIRFYQALDAASPLLKMIRCDTTDAGYPLHVLLFNSAGNFNVQDPASRNRVVILLNNGIHPGEPDGIDASMLLIRNLITKQIKINSNILLAVIPVYNIGGALKRNSTSRVSQQGPVSYGFRGNAQNLDLNRDFIKADSREAVAFEKIFQWLQPDIFVDNHVSDGADYQHTFTLLTTQHNKLPDPVGKFLHDEFEPAIYQGMQQKGWDVCPYVNFEEALPGRGWTCFYDPARYSSGYAALFSTISFVPETHMLKPFAARVKSTYAFMQSLLETAVAKQEVILEKRLLSINSVKQSKLFYYQWNTDSSRTDTIVFSGYDTGMVTSKITGEPRMFYNHDKPFSKEVTYYNFMKPLQLIVKPKLFIIPAGWHAVIQRLQVNGVKMQKLKKDTAIICNYYRVDRYETYKTVYEKHYKHYNIQYHTEQDTIAFHTGDYVLYTGQQSDLYIMETLIPDTDDSFFSWNFFDAILQPKEGYSDYRWEDVGGNWLLQNKDLKEALEKKKENDPAFAANTNAQLYFVYRHSPWFDPNYMRIPVYFTY